MAKFRKAKFQKAKLQKLQKIPNLWEQILNIIKPLENIGTPNEKQTIPDKDILLGKLEGLKSELKEGENKFYELFGINETGIAGLKKLQEKMDDADKTLDIMLPSDISKTRQKKFSKNLGAALDYFEKKNPKKETSKYEEQIFTAVVNRIAKKGQDIINNEIDLTTKVTETIKKGKDDIILNYDLKDLFGSVGSHSATRRAKLGKNLALSLAVAASSKHLKLEKDEVLKVDITPTTIKISKKLEDNITYQFTLRRSPIKASQNVTNLQLKSGSKTVEAIEDVGIWIPKLNLEKGANTNFGEQFDKYIETQACEDLFKKMPKEVEEKEGYTIDDVIKYTWDLLEKDTRITNIITQSEFADLVRKIGIKNIRGFYGELRAYLFLKMIAPNASSSQKDQLKEIYISATGDAEKIKVRNGRAFEQAPIDTFLQVLIKKLDSDSGQDPSEAFEFGHQEKNVETTNYSWEDTPTAPGFYTERLYQEMTDAEKRFFAAYGYFVPIDPTLTKFKPNRSTLYGINPKITQEYIDTVYKELEGHFNTELKPYYKYKIQNIIRLTTTIIEGQGVFKNKNELTNHFFIFHNIIIPASAIVNEIINLIIEDQNSNGFISSSFEIKTNETFKTSTWMYTRNGDNKTFENEDNFNNLIAGKENYSRISYDINVRFQALQKKLLTSALNS